MSILDPSTYLKLFRTRQAKSEGRGLASRSERERLIRVANERTKLTANFINSVAIDFMVLGVVRPYLENDDQFGSYAGSIVPLSIGVIFHLMARRTLSRLKKGE